MGNILKGRHFDHNIRHSWEWDETCNLDFGFVEKNLRLGILISRPIPDEDPGPMMIPIEILTTTPTPTEKSEVRDIFSEISPFEGFEQRNQNECKFQNIYEAQKPIDFSSHRWSSKIQSGPSMMS